MSEYVVLIIGDADRWWTSMTMKDRKEGYAAYARFNQQLAERGLPAAYSIEIRPTISIE